MVLVGQHYRSRARKLPQMRQWAYKVERGEERRGKERRREKGQEHNHHCLWTAPHRLIVLSQILYLLCVAYLPTDTAASTLYYLISSCILHHHGYHSVGGPISSPPGHVNPDRQVVILFLIKYYFRFCILCYHHRTCMVPIHAVSGYCGRVVMCNEWWNPSLDHSPISTTLSAGPISLIKSTWHTQWSVAVIPTFV